MPPFSVSEQIQATEGGESRFPSNSNFSTTVRFRFAIDVLLSVENTHTSQQTAEGQTSSEISERLLPEAMMRCNSCWQELEGRAVSTACGHLFCTEDAGKILNNDAACPVCDQVLTRSLMKPVDINPNEEWANMAMAGVSPQILMKSAYRSVMFFIGQKELQMQFKVNRMVAQCRQKCEAMQEKFTEKLEQVHTAYQKLAMKCQMMEQEIERLSKEKQELQEQLAEKSRQKRKVDEMYDHLKSEYECVKRSSIRPVSKSNLYSSTEPDIFADTTNMMGSGDRMRKDGSISRPQIPGPGADIWPAPARQTSSNNSGHFSFPAGSPMRQSTITMDTNSKRRLGGDSAFGGGAPSNPSMPLRNLILSPIKRPQLTRNNRTQMF